MEINTHVCITYVHQHTTPAGARGIQDGLVYVVYEDKHVRVLPKSIFLRSCWMALVPCLPVLNV